MGVKIIKICISSLKIHTARAISLLLVQKPIKRVKRLAKSNVKIVITDTINALRSIGRVVLAVWIITPLNPVHTAKTSPCAPLLAVRVIGGVGYLITTNITIERNKNDTAIRHPQYCC